jgi:hypothetical protein
MRRMKHRIALLWRGEIPLARAFWLYAVACGAALNLIATIVAFTALASGSPPVLAVALFLLPLPYNVFTVIVVWRAADRYDGDARWAAAARLAAILWASLLTLV